MAFLTSASPTNAVVVWSRYVLAVLSALFVVGVLIQVFLAGLAVFDVTSNRWDDHANFGHLLGVITYVLWVPAVLGRVGLRLIGAAFLMLILMALQYIFVGADGEPSVQALHPVNALVMFSVSAWIAWQTFSLLKRSPAAEIAPAATL